MTEKLILIFQLVNDWLKFAEAKNAILFAFLGAGITAIVTYLSAAANAPKLLQIALLISMSLLFIGAIVCAISFLPKTDIERILWLRGKPSRKNARLLKDTDSFYFFGDIEKYSNSELLASINRLYFDDKFKVPFKKEDLDIANQIIVNSQIASRKFRFFVVSFWFLIFAIIPISVSLISVIASRICEHR
jgi:Family of unknown function (DUF5706)